MKQLYPKKTYIIGLLFLSLISYNTIAQVGIGNTNPNANSLLEIGDGTDTGGVLLPRVTLSATTNPSPLATDVAGMIVYNTNTAGDVTPGFYYNDGALWVRLGAGTASDDWTTTGNAGTTAGTNFLGTTDGVDVVLATNGNENMRLVNGGQVTVNETAPFAGDRFTVTGDANDYAINAYASGASGVGVYSESSGSDAVVGIGLNYGVYGSGDSRGIYGVNSTTGQGVRGWSSGSGFGVFGSSTTATAEALGAKNYSTGTALIAAGSNGTLWNLPGSGATINGTTGILGLTTSSTGTGISGVGNGGTTSSTLTDGSGVAGVGDTGVYGISDGTNGTGIIGTAGSGSAITTNSSGSGISGSGLTMGVFGYAGSGIEIAANYGNAGGEFVLDGDNDPTTNSTNAESNRARAILAGFDNVDPPTVGGGARASYFGGFFSGGNENGGTQTYSYVALRHRIGSAGTVGGSTTDFKIVGPGNNSTLVKDSNGTPRILFSPEAPEIVFQDFGVGQLNKGTARISLDKILKGSLHIDDKHPLKVYVTLEGECNGIFVTDKSVDGFTVKELQGGTSNVSFSWQIVASRADTKDSTGRIVSKHVGVRLPIGPGPIGSELKKLEIKEEEAKEVKDDSKDASNIKSVDSKLESVISEKKD